jgi:hypothetical protein
MKMKRLLTNLFTWLIMAGTAVTGQELIHYWNFNNELSVSDMLQPSQTIGGAQINHIQIGGSSVIEVGTGQDFDVENLNARNGDAAGSHLRFNLPIEGALEFELPTSGYQNTVISFVTRRSGSGAGEQTWFYSLNGGADYTLFQTIEVTETSTLHSLNFSAITAVNDNADFRVKVEFAAGTAGTAGNNRFDNFTVDANPLSTIELIHYWNFNNDASLAELITPTQTIGGGLINHIQIGGNSVMEAGTANNFDIENLNARNGDEAGSHLRFNLPIEGAIEFEIPTTDYEDILVQFVTRRSGSGAGEQTWYYSVNGGTDYTLFSTIEVTETPTLYTLNFSPIATVNDNSDFRVKVEFAQGTAGTAGNNRFDNFTVEAIPFGSGGGPAEPELMVNSSAIVPFEQTLGYPSSEQTILVAGSDLVNDIEISVTGNFEISLTSGTDFASSVTIPAPLGFVMNTPVYVRLNASTEGISNGTVTISTTDVEDVTISLEGTTEEPISALLYYWHFNDLTTASDVTEIDADFTLLAGFTGKFEYTDPIEGERDIDRFSPGTNLNIQMGVAVGSGARVRNPAATRSLVFDVPTTGAENIVFTYAIQRSNNGSQTNTIEYSLDGGVTFITVGLTDNVQPVADVEVWQLLTYDFTPVTGANNNPDFKIRIRFEDINAANPSGNNRYDNITLTGNVVQPDLGLHNLQQINVNAYPNPASEALTIDAQETIEHIYVFDSAGGLATQYGHVHASNVSFDITSLQSGIYTVLIQSVSGFSQVKFVKK